MSNPHLHVIFKPGEPPIILDTESVKGCNSNSVPLGTYYYASNGKWWITRTDSQGMRYWDDHDPYPTKLLEPPEELKLAALLLGI